MMQIPTPDYQFTNKLQINEFINNLLLALTRIKINAIRLIKVSLKVEFIEALSDTFT